MKWRCLECGSTSPRYTPWSLYLGRAFCLLAMAAAVGLWMTEPDDWRSITVWGFAMLFMMSGMKGAYEHDVQRRDAVLAWLKEHEELPETHG